MLLCLQRAVEVARAVLGPPLEFQDVHVTVLLQLQDSRDKPGETGPSAETRAQYESTLCTY